MFLYSLATNHHVYSTNASTQGALTIVAIAGSLVEGTGEPRLLDLYLFQYGVYYSGHFLYRVLSSEAAGQHFLVPVFVQLKHKPLNVKG